LSVTASNSGPFSYQWQFDGTNLPVIINTVAGNGTEGEWGDGGQATNAEFYTGSVAADAWGNFFIADSANNRIRKVNSNGIIATVAGNGTNGYSGDGGPATNAELFNPTGAAVDALGNLYIADKANNCIRMVATNGVISTVAGDGLSGYSGDGLAAVNAKLSDPMAVAVDALGNLYIADQLNNCIREVGTNGIISTLAGNGTQGFSGDGGAATNATLSSPDGVAVDRLGNVFIADSGNKRVREVSITGAIITVAGSGNAGYFGDGGPATNAFLESPAGVAIDGLGNLFIADGTEHDREVGVNGIISTVAGNAGFGFSGDGGPPTNAMLRQVYGVALDGSGNLLIADSGNNRIRKATAFAAGLPLNNFQFAEVGTYDLIVSNPFGTSTSAVMVVTADLAPLSASLAGKHSLNIEFSGNPGSNYVLQMATNLAPPIVWQSVATNAADINGSGSFSDAPGGQSRFYRLSLP
jgi:sugar lactone lactonase YvrE